MKSTALLLIALSFTFLTYCQEKAVDLEKMATQILQLDNSKYAGNEYVKYNGIEVIDGRPDSSKIGYWKVKAAPQFVKVNLSNGTKDIEYFANRRYAQNFSKSPYALLLVIKKLWISQLDTTTKNVSTLVDDASTRKTIVNLKFEFYLRHGNDFYPIVRIDTISIFDFLSLQDVVRHNLSQCIISSLQKPLSSDPAYIIQSKKKLTLNQIMDRLSENKNHPVLTSLNYTKGVFASFSDFLKNKPTQEYNNVDYTKYGDVLFIKEKDGSEYPSNKFWGYSDGKNLFISSGKNFFQLIRTQNSFAFLGTKGLEKKLVVGNFNRMYLGSSTGSHNRVDMRYFIYQLDMETGGVL